MAQGQEACKQQGGYEELDESNAGTGWNPVTDRWNQRYEGNQKCRNRNHSLAKILSLEEDTQVQNCQKPEREENNGDRVKRELVKRDTDVCVLIRLV